jgi:nitrogen fixation protein FixH
MCHREEVRRGDLCWQPVYNEEIAALTLAMTNNAGFSLCISMHKGIWIMMELLWGKHDRATSK